MSPVQVAVITDSEKSVQVFLEAGTTPLDKRFFNHSTPAYLTGREKSINCLKMFLDNGLNPMTHAGFRGGKSLLHDFSDMIMWPDGLRLLLEYGADANSFTDEGETALHLVTKWARQEESLHCAEILLAHGADPNLRSKSTGSTALHYCSCSIYNNNTIRRVVRLLVKHGADVTPM